MFASKTVPIWIDRHNKWVFFPVTITCVSSSSSSFGCIYFFLKKIPYWLNDLLSFADFTQLILKINSKSSFPLFKSEYVNMNKLLTLSVPATYIYNLEVTFDPKSAFNYHGSYTGWKNDSIISRTQQGCDQSYLMSTVILRLLLLITVGLL